MNRTWTAMGLVLGLAGLAGNVLGGCVEKSEELSEAEQQQLEAFVTEEAPSPEHDLDISFENKVKLVGYDVSDETWTEGEQLTVTWYWKVERPLEEGWLLFTHIADASGENRLNQDGESVVRRLYPPGRWKAGEYVADKQRITLPEDWDSSHAVFYLGVWNGPHRLQVVQGPSDGDNRARALRIPVEQTTPSTPQPQVSAVQAKKAEGEITVDGKLDEDAWGEAAETDRFVNTQNGGRAEPETKAKLLWDDENLYVAFTVADDFLKSEFEDRDANLWEQDVVEIFVDPDGDGRNYYELQVSPNGVLFDTRYDQPGQPDVPGHTDWNPDVEAKVETRGTVGDDETDEGYTAEIAIPWSAFGDAGTPSANDTWRMNLYVMDVRQDGNQRSAGWSPTRTNTFHAPARFGRVTFVDGSEQAAAPAAERRPPMIAPQKVQLPANLMQKLRKRVNANPPGEAEAMERNRPRPGEEMPRPPSETGNFQE